jgi:hypothetical protein
MPKRPLFTQQPDVINVPHLHAFVHTRLQLSADRDIVEDDLETAIAAGDVADTEAGIAAFCHDYFDVSASIFPVALDGRGRWQRAEE